VFSQISRSSDDRLIVASTVDDQRWYMDRAQHMADVDLTVQSIERRYRARCGTVSDQLCQRPFVLRVRAGRERFRDLRGVFDSAPAPLAVLRLTAKVLI
jgi:hypothetical protein